MNRSCRILFEKTGRAKYISHLDLMRTMQRAFIRAGIKIKHTEGFNPHPHMVFALPLSVCCESVCELLDVVLTNADLFDTLPDRLCRVLPEGITAVKAYEPCSKFKDIQWIRISSGFEYRECVSDVNHNRLCGLFGQDSIIIPKKTKKGLSDVDIAPMIKNISFEKEGSSVYVDTVLSAQNPSLNPEHIITAIKTYLPEIVPEHYYFKRVEIYNSNMEIFR